MSKDLVSPERIDSARMETGSSGPPTASADPLTRDPIIDQKMGWLGKVFGYGDEKKGNLAVLGFIFSAALLTVCLMTPMFTEFQPALDLTSNMVTPLFGILTGIIGYVTGHKSEG